MKNLENIVVCSTFVGEGTEFSAKDLAKWMTGHLKRGTVSRMFKNIWKRYYEGNGDECYLAKDFMVFAPGMSINKSSGKEELWRDVLQFEDLYPDQLYTKAVVGGADRFIIFNNNALIDLVALRGYPSPRDIAIYVLGNENIGGWNKKDEEDYIDKEYLKEYRSQSDK